ncbi:MAG: winged helix-turn-helix transcriptional regulator [Candidatus Dormibacteria bacterium]
MRSYHQYCSVAKALDVVGDRWTLLVVRELALRGACRYSDLQDGLPGISTNLLADRLRELEAAEVVLKREPKPPIATPVFELTEHGQELVPVLKQLMTWGLRYMVPGPGPDDHFRARWMIWPAETYLTDNQPEQPAEAIQVLADDEPITVEVDSGRVSAHAGDDTPPDATITGDAHSILALFTGYIDLENGHEANMRYTGEESAIKRVLPGETRSSAPIATDQ